MDARLVYVMDPMCSWCWGFAPVIERLAEQAAAAGVGLHLVVGGLRSERGKLDAAGRERILGYWRAVQAGTGQRFNFEAGLPAGLVYDTEPACRALVTARAFSEEAAWTLAGLIQRAFYLEGRDVTGASALRELAEQAGLPAEGFAEAFDLQASVEATQADICWARDLGIAGFPTLLARRDGMHVLLSHGYQPLDRLAPLLARWLEQGGHG
ncbi:DsbA family protein [Stutzerimonas tarimensis]|uniref:DsbA family protein n=1 Tax=Stutzerimonas tarimensis TaxID=1507735 RepID=A0ABV7TCG5_9GAMM